MQALVQIKWAQHLPNHKCCGLEFYSPCYILFLTCKSPKSQSPHEVLAESPWSPSGVLQESPRIIGNPQGVLSNVWGSVTYSRCWNWLDSPTWVIFSTLNLPNQIYTSKWYDNYNIVLCCNMYSGLMFLLRSSKFFLPFTCLCLFFWSAVIPRSLPLWTLLFSSVRNGIIIVGGDGQAGGV